MIFVATGTTGFDALVETVDHLAPTLAETVVMQIGHGRYVPQQAEYFRFAPSLDPYYEQASLVISHGGLATTMEVLTRGLPLISVSNPDRYDDHQQDLLSALGKEGYVVWCRRLSDLAQAIETARAIDLRRYQPSECKIPLVINEFLCEDSQRHQLTRYTVPSHGTSPYSRTVDKVEENLDRRFDRDDSQPQA